MLSNSSFSVTFHDDDDIKNRTSNIPQQQRFQKPDLMNLMQSESLETPTASPTASPESVCLKPEMAEIAELVPTAISAFISECIESESTTNIIQIRASFAESLPFSEYHSLVITLKPLRNGDVIDAETGKLRECTDICSGQNQEECRCIEGTVDTRTGSKNLYFIVDPDSIGFLSVTLLADDNEIDSVQFSLFERAFTEPIVFELAPKQFMNNLMNNALIGNVGQKIVIKVPKTEDDVQMDDMIKLEAIALMFDDLTAKQPFTKTCRLKEGDACSVIVDTSYDYNVQIWNEGRSIENVRLFVEAEIGGDTEDALDVHHALDLNFERNAVYAVTMILVMLILAFLFKVFLKHSKQKRNESIDKELKAEYDRI